LTGLTDEAVEIGDIARPVSIGREQLQGFLHQLAFSRDDAEAAAVVDVQVGEVEGEDVEDPAIHDEQLVVVADEVVGRPRHRDAGVQQAHLEFAQALFAAMVGIGDERRDRHAALGRRLQCRLDLRRSNLKMTISTLFLAFSIAATNGFTPSWG
jgi:hypothetical protein